MKLVVLLPCVLVLSGCGLVGPGDLTVQVEFRSVANLVVDSEVKVDDVTVGTVRRVELDGWHAKLTLGLDRTVHLPRNATAKIGQKSLLGAEYVELGPPSGEAPSGALDDGDLIPLSRTSRYPETEELLAGLALWLNGGGLANLRTIYDEVDKALSGKEQVTRDLLDKVSRFAKGIDDQKAAIVKAIDALDAFSGPLAAQRDKLGDAIDHVAPGIAVFADQTDNIDDMLSALSTFSTVSTRVVNESKEDLMANLNDLKPILAKLVDAGDSLPRSLDVASTLLYPLSKYGNVFRGDFANLIVTLDLSPSTLARNLLGGALQAANPLLAPLGGG